MSKGPLRVCAVRLFFVAIIFGFTTFVGAQVFDPPTAKSNVGVQQAGGPASMPQSGAVEQTGWGIPMPKITMPKITMPKITMPSMATVTGPFKSGFGKVSLGTRKAWEGTKEMFSFGKNRTTSTTRPATNSQQQPSFWHRLLAREPEPQVPQTVGEFMRQSRLDP